MLHLASVITLLAIVDKYLAATLTTCGGSLSGMYGDFQSPGFPDKNSAAAACIWRLTVPVGYYIRLEFAYLALKVRGLQCNREREKVIVSEGTERLALLCGIHESNESIVSTNHSMQVKLTWDHLRRVGVLPRPRGLWVYYSAVDINECAVDNGGCSQRCHNYIGGHYCSCKTNYVLQPDKKFCKVLCNGITKTDLQGVISTPEYPDIYPDQALCDWCITLPLGYQVKLTFTAMDIEYHHEVQCPYDHLKIDTGRSAQTGPYCGEKLPSPVVSQANRMCLYFTSDDSVGHRGFTAKYNAKPLDCGDPGTPVNGRTNGRNYTYPNRVTYRCNSGFVLVGLKIRSCQTDGTWSGTLARCERVSCGDPGQPSHGSRIIIDGVQRTYVYEDKVKLSCNQYYSILEGDTIRTCRADGSWSGSQLKCTPTCGRKTIYNDLGRVIGGLPARRGSFPWMAMLQLDPCDPTTQQCVFCGGSILNNNFVLTAAHCNRFAITIRTQFVVRVGAHNVSSNTNAEWWCNVEEIIEHPLYDHIYKDYDAALIRIANCTSKWTPSTTVNEIVLSDYIRPICLPNASLPADQRLNLYNAGNVGTAAGWGIIDSTVTQFAETLRYVHLPISNTSNCRTHFRRIGRVTPRMFCADGSRRDTCYVDSGGPFMIQESPISEYIILGVVSWGDRICGTGYGVYTNVRSIVAWINRNIGN